MRQNIIIGMLKDGEVMQVAWWRNGIGRRTCDRQVVGSTSGRVAIKWFLPYVDGRLSVDR